MLKASACVSGYKFGMYHGIHIVITSWNDGSETYTAETKNGMQINSRPILSPPSKTRWYCKSERQADGSFKKTKLV